MTNEVFYKLLDEMTIAEREIMVGKGREYTIGSKDKLQNFKDVARQTGLEPIKVWSVYFLKHIASIQNYVKDGVEASTEPIEGRIMDARNYLALLAGIIKEKKDSKIPDPIKTRALYDKEGNIIGIRGKNATA